MQAAVQAKADKLDFKFGRNKTLVQIAGGEAWSLLGLQGSLENLDGASPSHSELLVGLRSLASTHEFILRDDKGDSLRWVGDVLSYTKNGHTRGSALQMEVRRRKRRSGFRQWLKERIQEHASSTKLLQSRARFAPLTLRVDGRPITSARYECRPPGEDQLCDERTFETPLLWAGLTTDRPLNVPGRLKVANKKILCDPLMSERFFTTYEESDSELPRAHLLLVASCTQTYIEKDYLHGAPFADNVWVTKTKRSNFQIHVSRFGVVCDSFRTRAPLGGELHLPCDQLGAGLTGLEAREQQPVLQEAHQYIGGLNPLLEELRRQILEHQPSKTLPRSDVKAAARMAVTLGAATLGACSAFGLGVLAAGKVGLATGGGVVFAFRTQQLDRDGVEEIARAVTQFQLSLANDALQFQRY